MAKSFDYIFALALVFSIYGVCVLATQNVSIPNIVLSATSRITFDMNEMVQLIDELSEMEMGVVSSPLSVTLPLAVLLAFSYGYTQRQLMNFIVADDLGFSPTETHTPYLLIESSDASLVQYSQMTRMFYGKHLALTNVFKELNKLLGVKSSAIDFHNIASASDEINSIISSDTNSRIPNAVDTKLLDPATDLIVINVVNFKGMWQCKFDANKTADLPFHRDDGVTDLVPTMFQVDFLKVAHSDKLQSTLVVLPFSEKSFDFILILPDENNLIKNISKKLEEEPNLLTEALAEAQEYIVEITMPKFNMTTKIFMKQTLEWLGVTTIMDERVSNMRNIFADGHDAHVTNILQHVIVKVDEEGAEVSSASASNHADDEKASGFGAKPFQVVKADRPFLFTLRKNSVNFLMGSYQGNISRHNVL